MVVNNQQRNAAIDALRGIAILLVLSRHLDWKIQNLAGRILFPIHSAGWMGVDLFFVISGYLISGLLFKEYLISGRINSKNFLIRRGFKIYPTFWILLLATLIIQTLVRISPELSHLTFTNYLHEFLFIQNYASGIWDHTWSLAVEEHFYIFFIIVLYLLIKNNKLSLKYMLGIYLTLAAVCLGFRYYYNFVLPHSQYALNYAMTHLRMDALFFGVLLSYLTFFNPEILKKLLSLKKILLPVFTVLLIASAYYGRTTNYGIVFLLLTNSWAFGYLLMVALDVKHANFKRIEWLAFIGRYSYSIYIWHIPVKMWIVNQSSFERLGIHYNWYAECFLYFLFSILLGFLSAKIIEYPFLHIRDNYFPSKASLYKKAVIISNRNSN